METCKACDSMMDMIKFRMNEIAKAATYGDEESQLHACYQMSKIRDQVYMMERHIKNDHDHVKKIRKIE